MCVSSPSACHLKEILYPCGRTVTLSHLCRALGEVDLFPLGKVSEFRLCQYWLTVVQEASLVLPGMCPLPAVIPLSTAAASFPAAEPVGRV